MRFMVTAGILGGAVPMFMIAPSRKHRRANVWKGCRFAHRGLHADGIPENSLKAFAAACSAGFGIELDVQVTSDGALVVFHDEELLRMTGDPRRVSEVTLDELRTLDIGDGCRIPTFEEVLQLVDGRVPLLIELKNCRSRNNELCEKSLALLRRYRGEYIVESFNPLILRWLKKNAPEIIRGQLVGASNSYIIYMSTMLAYVLSTMSLNFLARPDFVAYDVSARFRSPKLQRHIFHTPMAAWTVRDNDTYARCISRGEMPIFEGFIPEE